MDDIRGGDRIGLREVDNGEPRLTTRLCASCEPGNDGRDQLGVQGGFGRVVAAHGIALREILTRSRLMLEHVIGILGEEEADVTEPRRGSLKGFRVGLPIDLEILLPDDDEYGNANLRERRRRVRGPKFTGKRKVGGGLQA